MEKLMFNLNEGLIRTIFPNGGVIEVAWHFYAVYLAFALGTILIAYLLGSINSAIIISKVLYRDDIRRHGSGNAGLTNMHRTYGGKAAILTLVGDIAKTAIAVCIAGVLFGFNYVGGVSTGDGFCYVAGLFAMLGHIFPIYYKFKGGKGVLVSATMGLILSPIPFLLVFVVFVIMVALTKYVSLGSVSGAVLYPVIMHGYFAAVMSAKTPGLVSLSCIILAIVIVWCHRGNLQRISDRTERKLSFKKKKNDDENE